LQRRPDDPRLGEVVEFWQGQSKALHPGRAVLLGFPQDEGVRRNQGRPGAAAAPAAIRHWLYRLTPYDCASELDLQCSPPLDIGDVRLAGNLEETQEALAVVIAAILRTGAIPIVLGGGHETAYGHYLGYVAGGVSVGILNLDAHLDVRPTLAGQGHSGSAFRQALQHPTHPLAGQSYTCLGVQPQNLSRSHWQFAQELGCRIYFGISLRGILAETFQAECVRLGQQGCHVYVTLDADVVQSADVPGVSAPNPAGLPGAELLGCARLAGSLSQVSSLDLVEINPGLDRDGQSARWAALVIWNFLLGLTTRRQL
jgi:formiminoglutamase